MKRTVSAWLVGLAGAGCSNGSDAPAGLHSEARDSAGITIVENAAPARESRLGWTIGPGPSVSIGSIEAVGAYQLFLVLDAAKLSDGRILVANAGTSEVAVFDAGGTHLATWGGAGEGPGEFDGYSPEAVAPWPGDSVMAASPLAKEIAVFDSDGNHGRTFALDDGYGRFQGLLPDGRIVGQSVAVFRVSDVRQDETWGILSVDGDLSVSLGGHPGAEWYVSRGPDGNPTGALPHPFGRSSIAAVWGDLVVISPNDRYEIRAYRSDGVLARIVRRDHDLRSPTQADLGAYLEGEYGDLPEDRRAVLLDMTRDIPLGEGFPAFASLQADPLGYLWVEEYALPGDDRAIWTVFDAGGRVQGFVETPRDVAVFEIGEDYVLGHWTDEFGAEHVQVWPLARSG